MFERIRFTETSVFHNLIITKFSSNINSFFAIKTLIFFVEKIIIYCNINQLSVQVLPVGAKKEEEIYE